MNDDNHGRRHSGPGAGGRRCGAGLAGPRPARRDPNIIFVGEIRDSDTASIAVNAALTGHLVFSTLHTSSAARTVDRIIEVFPAEEQMQIRSTLADGIRAVISQVLIKRIDRKGRCAAMEIMIANSAVRNLIRESKTRFLR